MDLQERIDIVEDFRTEHGLGHDEIEAIRPVAQMMEGDPDGLTSMIQDYFGIDCYYDEVVELQKAMTWRDKK